MLDLENLKASVLASGRIGDQEVDTICRELYADGRLDRDVVVFLAAVRREAQTVCASFEQFFTEAVKLNLIEGGNTTREGIAWLRRLLLGDYGIDEGGKRLLWNLKRVIPHPGPEFRSLYDEIMG